MLYVCVCVCAQSYPTLETLWTIARQAPLSLGFSRQEYWSGLPFPSLGDLPDLGIEPRTPVLQTDTLLSEPPNLYLFLIMDLHGLPRWC